MGLSKVSNLFVIARNSTFTYKGKSLKVQQIGKELGVKYVLEGSVQRASDRVRITAQLIDATTGYHLWVDLASGRSKSPLLELEEMEKCALNALKLSDSSDFAHGLLGHVYVTKRQHQKAIEEGNTAIALNPNGADSHAFLASFLSWSGKPQKAIELMKRAYRLNPIPPPYYFSTLGMAYRMNGQYLEAIEVCKKAIIKSPDFALPYVTKAASYISLGQLEKANQTVTEILRIIPKYSWDTIIVSVLLPELVLHLLISTLGQFCDFLSQVVISVVFCIL
jgi:adenylate cyclase